MSALPETLKRPIERLERIEPLNPMDYGHTEDPEVIERMQSLIRPLQHFSTTEKGTGDTIEHLFTMFPNSEIHRASLPLWLAHESEHGVIIDDELKALGAKTGDEPTGKIPALYHALGFIGEMSDGLNIALGITASGTAVSHEFTTKGAYVKLAEEVEKKGASEFAEALRDIMPQESAHLAYYIPLFKYYYGQANHWQRWLGMRMMRLSWQPVGAKQKARRADFGSIACEVYGEETMDEEASRLQRKISKLLLAGEDLLPKFIEERVRGSVAAYKESIVA